VATISEPQAVVSTDTQYFRWLCDISPSAFVPDLSQQQEGPAEQSPPVCPWPLIPEGSRPLHGSGSRVDTLVLWPTDTLVIGPTFLVCLLGP
jgi:hypothetical protein